MKITIGFTYPDQGSSFVSTIYISVNDFTFPDATWTDFVLIVLNWWNEELINQLEGGGKGEYLFMDGPFYFECEFLETDEIEVTFKQRKSGGSEVLYLTNVKKENFINEIRENTNFILRECHENNFSSEDVNSLNLVYKKLLNTLK